MSASGFVHLEDCAIVRETDWAFQIELADELFWIPKSQVANPDDYAAGMKGCTISITEFIAREKGINVGD